ncbi:MAG: lytic transglycosylase domain-containing protein [Deltaproteobacteria bacterium]|nr:lytic transglycosylase domain-containing protein [Deltaproteobacteria bacterium]
MRLRRQYDLVWLVILLAPQGAAAKIYKVVDRDGNITYTNRPPGSRAAAALGSASIAPPGAPTRYNALIADAALRFALPESFIRAVVRSESNFNPRAVSRAGAEGLMQLIPETARRMGVRDAFDPRQNIQGGSRYLRFLADTFAGQLPLVIAAYHAGEDAVARAQGLPAWSTTREYVRMVLTHHSRFQAR